MAFTFIRSASGNGASVGSGGTRTDTVVFSAAPSAGQYCVIALFTNAGSAVSIVGAGVGTTALTQIDSGNFIDPNINANGNYTTPLVYGGYITATPGSGTFNSVSVTNATVSVRWTNNTGVGATMCMAAILFTGTATSTTANSYAQRLALSGGLIDGSSPSTSVSLGNAAPQANYSGDGTTLTITTGRYFAVPQAIGTYATILGSSVTALNGLPIYVQSWSSSTGVLIGKCSYTGSQVETNFGAYLIVPSAYNSSNTSSGGWWDYTNSGITTWGNYTYSSYLPTSYVGQQQPWIGAFYSQQTTFGTQTNLSSAITISAGTTTVGTISVTATTGAASSGKFVLPTTSGNIVVSYSGTTSTTFTGCTIVSALGQSVTAPIYSNIIYPTSTTQGLSSVLASASSTSTVLGGLVCGNSTPASGVLTQVRQTLTAGFATGSLILMCGYVPTNAKSLTPIFGASRINGGTPGGMTGSIYSFVPATQTLTPENASAVATAPSQAAKVIARTRIAKATQVFVATLARTIGHARISQATQILIANSSRVAWYVRTSQATQILIAKSSRVAQYARTLQATQILIAKSSRVVRYVRTLRATRILIAKSSRVIRHVRIAQATLVRIATTNKNVTKRVQTVQIRMNGLTKALSKSVKATQIRTSKLNATRYLVLNAFLRLTVSAKSVASAKGNANAALGVTYTLTSTSNAKAQLSAALRETLSLRGTLIVNPAKGCAHANVAVQNNASALIATQNSVTVLVSVGNNATPSVDTASYITSSLTTKTLASNRIEQC